MSEELNRLGPGPRRPERRKKKKGRRKRASEPHPAGPLPNLNSPVPTAAEIPSPKPDEMAPEFPNRVTMGISGVQAPAGGAPPPISPKGMSLEASKEPPFSGSKSSSIVPSGTGAAPSEASLRQGYPKAPTAPKSPRKMALLRSKKSAGAVPEPEFVSELNEKKKSRPGGLCVEPEDGRYPMLLAGQNMDGKSQLFAAASSQIMVYHEQLQNSRSQTSGTLLAHGEFEVFQLHNGDVTYFACGRSFVYPLLPKLKILQTSRSEFVLPLVNPERYWKIHIDSATDTELRKLSRVLNEVVNYTNLAAVARNSAAVASNPAAVTPNPAAGDHHFPDWGDDAASMVGNESIGGELRDQLADATNKSESAHNPDQLTFTGQFKEPGSNEPDLSNIPEQLTDLTELTELTDLTELTEQLNVAEQFKDPDPSNEAEQCNGPGESNELSDEPNRVHLGDPEGGADTRNLYSAFFNDVPDSPPSVPASPQQASLNDTMNLSSLSGQFKKTPQNSMNPASASSKVGQYMNVALMLERSDAATGQKDPASHNPSQAGHVFPNPSMSQGGHPTPKENIAQNGKNAPQSRTPQALANIAEPKPAKHSNPFFRQGPSEPAAERRSSVSSSSSMDSLLDEYEENISTTQSIHYPESRPASRGTSYVSAVRSGTVNRQRYSQAHLHTQSRFGSDPKHDDFPSTSLSQYEKNRQNSISERSRKSSISELYSSVSNWMDPGRSGPQLSHSKSIQSLASKKSIGRQLHGNHFSHFSHGHSHGHSQGHFSHGHLSHGNTSSTLSHSHGNCNPAISNPSLNDTYRAIYRSITSHDPSHDLESSRGHRSKAAFASLSKSPSMEEIRGAPRAPKGDALSPAQVYKLLSERDDKQQPSGLRRLFGW